jgi:hypothetical protein
VCYIGDDGTQAISYFPPTNESTPTNYFAIRATNTGNPHHCFSSKGNYYCGNSIYCTNINGTLIPTNSGGSITGINGYSMIFNAASNGGFFYNQNNIEMLIINKNKNTNYIGTSYNIFILNTGTCGIISKSLHTSPNYSNTYIINCNTYPSPFRGSSGTYEEFLIATHNVQAGNKVKLNYFVNMVLGSTEIIKIHLKDIIHLQSQLFILKCIKIVV